MLLSISLLAQAQAQAPLPAGTGEAGAEAEVARMLARIETQNTARLQQARALAATGQARLLYAASLLAPLGMDSGRGQVARSAQSLAWLAAASAGGSDDPLIAAAAVQACIAGEGQCALDAALDTLRGSDDAAQQLLLMRLAEHRGDAAAAASAWQRALAAGHYGDALAQLVALLDAATQDMRWPSSTTDGSPADALAGQARIVAVFAIAAAHWAPELQQVLQACPDSAVAADRAAQCQHLFAVMADSTSPLSARYATVKMATAQTPAQAQWRARLRDLDWVLEQATQLLSAAGGKDNGPSLLDYARWLGTEGELPAMRRLLAAHGVPLSPPAEWQPPSR